MEFDKINAFLATAIGGLIFKWLAGGVSSFWAWLNKSHPEEDFWCPKSASQNQLSGLVFASTNETLNRTLRTIKYFSQYLVL